MHLWEFICVCGIIFLLLEIFAPSMFFLNFALAAFICAPISIMTKNPYVLVTFFVVLSFASFVFLRPILIKRFNKDKETGIQSKYIGKTAKVEEDVTEASGVITLYGERWDARSEDGTVIPKGSEVKIIRNDSIIMYVTKCD